MEKYFIPRFFILFLVAAVIYACYLVFKPFLIEIIAAMILATIFYPWYEKLTIKFKGRKNLASLALCLLVSLLIIVPIANFIVFTAQKSVDAYGTVTEFVNSGQLENVLKFTSRLNMFDANIVDVQGFLIDMAKRVNEWLVSGTTGFIMGTTNFLFSLALILIILYFFFVDGKRMITRIMQLTPMPNKYDKDLFKKFRDVSLSTLVSTLLVAIAQALVAAIGFMIIGIPAFFPSMLIAFASIVPPLGATLVWLPIGVYLLIFDSFWKGLFILIWGAVLVSLIDNIIRGYIIKDKAEVHPIFVVLSILGGITLFGFWGVIFGPLIISLAVTVFHIYENEFETVLDK